MHPNRLAVLRSSEQGSISDHCNGIFVCIFAALIEICRNASASQGAVIENCNW